MMVAFLEEETGAVAILGIVGIVFVVVALILISFRLIRPILAPTIVAFPWDTTNKSKEKQTVILAGSYNPPHLGHLAMLQYLAKRCVKFRMFGRSVTAHAGSFHHRPG